VKKVHVFAAGHGKKVDAVVYHMDVTAEKKKAKFYTTNYADFEKAYDLISVLAHCDGIDDVRNLRDKAEVVDEE